jgi:hypothetical protein
VAREVPPNNGDKRTEVDARFSFQITLLVLILIVNRITADKKTWLDTMLKEEIGLTRERFVSPLKSALVMLTAETVGGFI